MTIKPLLRLARAPSLLLRRAWLRLRLGRFGDDTLVESGARLQYPERIRLGNGVRIASQARRNNSEGMRASRNSGLMVMAYSASSCTVGRPRSNLLLSRLRSAADRPVK